jgi:hypothetical protein
VGSGKWEKRMMNLLYVFKESVRGKVIGLEELCRYGEGSVENNFSRRNVAMFSWLSTKGKQDPGQILLP